MRRTIARSAPSIMSATSGASGGASAPESRIGGELRAARQRLGWSLPDVSQTLRIRLPYLEAIEEGRLSDLPGNVYAVGFIRAYATTLGLDAAEVARRFRAEAQDISRKPELAFPAPVPDRGVPAGAVVLLGVVITAGVYAGWYKLSGDARGPDAIPAVPERLAPLADRAAPPTPPPQVATVPPTSTPVPAPAPLPAPSLPAPAPVVAELPAATPAPDTPRVMLRFKADAYIQVRERQGPVLLNRVMRSGETWPVPRGAPLLLTTGNAGGTELLVEGVVSPAIGPSGAVRRDLPLDADSIRPGEALPSTQRAVTP